MRIEVKDDRRHVALQAAVDEAERFIDRARLAMADESPWAWASSRRATAKRASLDLTRALAAWRQTK